MKNNTYHGKTTLQITLSLQTEIVPVQEDSVKSHSHFNYVRIKDIKNNLQSVNVMGVLIGTHKKDVILKTGEVKEVLIVTLKDRTAQINVTFWSHISVIDI